MEALATKSAQMTVPAVSNKVPKYKVIMLNDDFTPMDFVVDALERHVGCIHEEAVRLMWLVHQEGECECGKFPRDIAETKVHALNAFSRQHGHPLLCEVRA